MSFFLNVESLLSTFFADGPQGNNQRLLKPVVDRLLKHKEVASWILTLQTGAEPFFILDVSGQRYLNKETGVFDLGEGKDSRYHFRCTEYSISTTLGPAEFALDTEAEPTLLPTGHLKVSGVKMRNNRGPLGVDPQLGTLSSEFDSPLTIQSVHPVDLWSWLADPGNVRKCCSRTPDDVRVSAEGCQLRIGGRPVGPNYYLEGCRRSPECKQANGNDNKEGFGFVPCLFAVAIALSIVILNLL